MYVVKHGSISWREKSEINRPSSPKDILLAWIFVGTEHRKIVAITLCMLVLERLQVVALASGTGYVIQHLRGSVKAIVTALLHVIGQFADH